MKPLPCPAADWPRFSALLDAGLDLAPETRDAWLRQLPPADAHLLAPLRSVLAKSESLSGGDWLDRPASGGGATKLVREVVAAASVLIPREWLKPTMRILES